MPRLRSVLWTKEDGTPTDAAVATALGATAVAGLRQVHGNRSIIARTAIARDQEGDGLATDVPGLCITARAADCQTLLVVAPAHDVCAVLHTGWKGLLAGAIPSLFATLQEHWTIAPQDVWVGLGPSLCAACAEFTDPVQELPGIDPRFFSGRHADLPAIADAQLAAAGVVASRRERHPHCTRCMPDRYWTYRGGDRTAVQSGSVNVLAAMIDESDA